MKTIREGLFSLVILGMLCGGAVPLHAGAGAEATGGAAPDPEVEINRKLTDLQSQIDQLKAELSQARKAKPGAVATASQPAAAAAAAEAQGAATASTPPATPAAAPAAAPEEKKTTLQSLLGPTTVSGFVDGYYGLNFNHPQTRTTPFRAFDIPANQFSLNYAKIQLDKPVDATNRIGYRISFGYGNAPNVFNSFEPGGLGFAQYMEEAYGSYLAPVGKNGLQIDFGKFVTGHGAEVIETKDNWNYSRSLLFNLAIPFYHFGLRAKYAWNSKVALSGYVVNGWNNVVDNNTGKTYGVMLSLNPNKKVAFVQNYMAGPEMAGTNQHWRQLSDTVFTINATDKLSFNFNYDYGTGDQVGVPGTLLTQTAWWTGVAGYVRYAFDGKHAFALRYEWFKDPQGFTTLTSQQIKEVTATFEKKIAGNLLTRAEYRHDYSTEPTFIKGNSPVKSQDTAAIGLVYVFSSGD